MSKLLCICGHTIVDQTESLSYKAYFLADEDIDECIQSTADAIEKFIFAREQGKLDEFFSGTSDEVYTKDSEVGDFINGVIAAGYSVWSRDMYECEQCGRIWLASTNKKGFFSYFPESGERGVLSSLREDRHAIREE